MSNQKARCGNSPFFGCRFSLYPMTEDFVPIILQAIEELKRPGIEVETGNVSTCIMGLETNVFAALRDTLAKAASTGSHVVMNATFSKGCPGEGLVNMGKYLTEGEVDFAAKDASKQSVACEFSMYPLGVGDYMDTIYQIIDRTKELQIYAGSQHFCTRLSGSIEQVFAGLEQAFAITTQVSAHVVMVATLSCNSPSKNKE